MSPKLASISGDDPIAATDGKNPPLNHNKNNEEKDNEETLIEKDGNDVKDGMTETDDSKLPPPSATTTTTTVATAAVATSATTGNAKTTDGSKVDDADTAMKKAKASVRREMRQASSTPGAVAVLPGAVAVAATPSETSSRSLSSLKGGDEKQKYRVMSSMGSKSSQTEGAATSASSLVGPDIVTTPGAVSVGPNSAPALRSLAKGGVQQPGAVAMSSSSWRTTKDTPKGLTSRATSLGPPSSTASLDSPTTTTTTPGAVAMKSSSSPRELQKSAKGGTDGGLVTPRAAARSNRFLQRRNRSNNSPTPGSLSVQGPLPEPPPLLPGSNEKSNTTTDNDGTDAGKDSSASLPEKTLFGRFRPSRRQLKAMSFRPQPQPGAVAVTGDSANDKTILKAKSAVPSSGTTNTDRPQGTEKEESPPKERIHSTPSEDSIDKDAAIKAKIERESVHSSPDRQSISAYSVLMDGSMEGWKVKNEKGLNEKDLMEKDLMEKDLGERFQGKGSQGKRSQRGRKTSRFERDECCSIFHLWR